VNTTVAPVTTTTQASLNPGHRFHPLVEIFPEMEKHAFAEFVADIKVNGVREPVTVHKNQIVDGRTRWLACEVLGIPCPLRAYEGKESDLLAFVVSKNLHRRQMNESQRAIVAGKIANMRQGERTDLSPNLGKVSTDNAAKLLNVSTGSVDSAKKVIAKAQPEVVKAVEQGKLAVSAAASIVEHPPEVQRQAVAKIDEGAKPAAVVRALPPSSGKAKPCAPAQAKPTKERKKAGEVWLTLFNLADQWRAKHKEEDLWDYDASQFWPHLVRDEQDELVEIAKMLMPWLRDILDQEAHGSKVGSKPKLVTKSAGVQ
jgi:ParB-like chromosome segregation protein Spo0J